MKRAVLILVISLLLVSPLFANIGMGWSVAPVGELVPDGSAFGALGIMFSLSPWVERHIGDLEVEVLLAPVDPFLDGINIKATTPIFCLLKNPFSFIFSNAVYWAPKIAIGTQYRMPNKWMLYMALSPFSFQDNEYVYDFLSPYVIYDIEENKWGWGAYIMRFSYFFGGTNG